jgi:hypothetical protein
VTTKIDIGELNYRNKNSNFRIWSDCDSPVFLVLDDRGRHREDVGRVRHMLHDLWLCMDADGNLSIVREEDIKQMQLGQDGYELSCYD